MLAAAPARPLISTAPPPCPAAALGAAAAFDGRNGRPKKVVVDVDGDGSFLMNCQVRGLVGGWVGGKGGREGVW